MPPLIYYLCEGWLIFIIAIDAKIRYSGHDRRGRIWRGAEVQVQRQQGRGGHQEVQRVRGGRDRQKDHHARSQGPQDATAPQHCRTQGGLPQKGHRLSRLLVRPEQPPRSAREVARWTRPRKHQTSAVSVAQGTGVHA